MPLPATITVNVGTPAADLVFSNPVREGTTVTYTAPSPQADLTGRPILRFSRQTTKGGISRVLAQVTIPIYQSSTGTYTGFETAEKVLKAPLSAPVALSDKALEIINELPADVNNAMARAEI